MGRTAIIIVLGLSLTMGVVGYNLNKSKKAIVENVSGFMRYTTARNIAQTGVNMLLRRLDRKDTSILGPVTLGQTVWRSINVMSGQCSLSVKLAHFPYLDTLDITSKARFMDTVRAMRVRLRRQPVPFPRIGEAVGLQVPNVNFGMSGSPLIDGRNYDAYGHLTSKPDSNDKPGVGVLSSLDSTTVYNGAAGGSRIDGTSKVVVDLNMADPNMFVKEYINDADTVLHSGVYNSGYWGSSAAPIIVFCSGNVKFNSAVQGWGILVVEGNLTLAGSFDWHGLVICYNSSSIDVQFAAGTPNVIGAVLMAGPSGSTFQLKGNSFIGYSAEALNMAKYIGTLQVYQVMYWYE